MKDGLGISSSQFAAEQSEKVQELEIQLREKDKLITGYRKEHGKLEVFFDRIINALEPITPFKSEFDINKKTKSEKQSAAVMHSSDQHEGSYQVPGEIEFFNNFNSEICNKRKVGFANIYLKWLSFQRSGFKINDLHIIDTGDNISGDIHDELKATNEHPTPIQVVKAAENSAMQVALLAPHFENVYYHFIVPDNHSRLTRKPQHKEAGQNSLNYLVGYILKQFVSKHTNVQFNLIEAEEEVVTVINRNYLCCHGHGVKGWAGHPYYGWDRKVGKESVARLQLIMREDAERLAQRARDIGFHKILHGHYHTSHFLPMYYGCASISGTDSYDHSAGRYHPPAQNGWIVHPEMREQCLQVFDLSDIY